MSTKNIIITQISNFIDELCTTYPQNTEIQIFKEKYYMLKGVNSQLIIEYFVKYIYVHKEIIMKEDVSFFLNGGGQEEIDNKNGLRLRDNLKNLWVNEMKEDNKKIVWKYFKTFILLIDKYISESK